MADEMLTPLNLAVTDSRRATPDANSGANADASYFSNWADTESIRTMRTALNTYDNKTYNTTNLNIMNANDIVFAWRQTSSLLNAKSIADYMVRQAAQP